MKFLSFFLLGLYLLCPLTMAAEFQSEFHIVGADQVVQEGDIVEGVLKIWPLENADLAEFRNLQEKVLFNAFYLTDIESLGPSENNADVVEMKALFIVQNNKGLSDQVFSYKGKSILIPVPKLKVKEAVANKEDYFIMDQSINHSVLSKILLAIVGVMILGIGFFKKNTIIELIKNLKNDPKTVARRKFKGLFLKAKTREEYEEIYRYKKEWLELIEEKAPAYNDFFKTMEQHQYKKSWGMEELNEVLMSFDVIRGSFK